MPQITKEAMTYEEIDKQFDEKFHVLYETEFDTNGREYCIGQWFEKPKSISPDTVKSFLHQIIKQTREADALIAEGKKLDPHKSKIILSQTRLRAYEYYNQACDDISKGIRNKV